MGLAAFCRNHFSSIFVPLTHMQTDKTWPCSSRSGCLLVGTDGRRTESRITIAPESSAQLSYNNHTTVPSISLWKTFFAWHFILNESVLFWSPYLIRNHFFSFSVAVFCTQILTPKMNLQPKLDLTCGVSMVNWFFFFFLILTEKIVFTFLCWFRIFDISKQYCEHFRKNWTSRTC